MKNPTAIQINLSYLYTVSGGDTTFEKMVLMGAVDDIQSQIEKLQSDWDKEDAVNIRRNAHSLKSVVAITGLSEIESNCKNIEQLFADEKFHPEGLVYLDKIVSLWIIAKPLMEEMIIETYP
jgi:HPt (histidine-containing phosphotransfer) domain-containing protein